MKQFHLTNNYCLINFDAAKCDSIVNIIQSKSFALVFKQFYNKLLNENNSLLKRLNIEADNLIDIYKQLLIYDFETLEISKPLIKEAREDMYLFIEVFYNYWRGLERFGLMRASRRYDQNARAAELIHTADDFNEKILFLYRTISEKLLSYPFSVYRQLPAGINANILYVNHRFSEAPKYTKLSNIAFTTNILTRPPFIFYTKNNKREGIFQEINYNPLTKIHINKLHYLAFPVKVGHLLAFVYIHRDFLHHGIALSNLFELAKFDEFAEKKPDLIYVYGIKEEVYDCRYYYDAEDKIYFGYVSRNDRNDYFGYLKKMLLTLHNLYMLDYHSLALHGAMVSVELNNEKSDLVNIVIIGDSGAGKSETLEALRIVGKDYIKNMRIIFDDMGSMHFVDKKVYASGTEIGAFVRLDDLEQGYAYQEMDRAIFLNPNQKNARVVIPVSEYNYIKKDHPVDIILYANNYEDKTGLRLFTSLEEAISVFKEGKRKAKGTTSEDGLVSSYFANPFGPLQKASLTDKLLVKYFTALKNDNVIIAEIYTKLAIPGSESSGPKEASVDLLKYLLKIKN